MKMLYAIFVLPFARLFAWFKMKWEWRGFATVTGEDFQKTGNEKKFRRDLKNDPTLKRISKDMANKLWPDNHPPYLCKSAKKLTSMSLADAQKIRKECGGSAFFEQMASIGEKIGKGKESDDGDDS